MPGGTAGGSTAAGAPGFQDGGSADPTQFIAPPRTEYDYSPLDLAPPGQRRRRQLVVGIVGVLALIVIAAAAVFGYLLLDNGNDKNDHQLSQLAAAQTVVAQNLAATGTPTTADVAQTSGSTSTVPATDGAAGTKKPTTAASGGQTTAPRPTVKPTTAAPAGPSVASLQKLLPGQDMMPQGLDQQDDTSLNEQAVVENLGDSRTAQQNLDKWGWSGNAGVAYQASDPSSLNADAVIGISVSIHGFSTAQNCTAAFGYFSDILVNGGGWNEQPDPKLGDKSRLLLSNTTDANGNPLTNVSLYVQSGRVLYKISGTAQGGGDPTDAVVQLATQMLGG